MSLRLLCLIVLLTVGMGVSADATDDSSLSGLWLGVAGGEQGDMRFNLELVHADDGLEGTFILIDEGGARIPVDSADFEDGSLSVTAMRGTAELQARLDGDEMTGMLNLPGGEMPARLARDGSAAAAIMTEEMDRRVAELRTTPFKLIRSGPGMDSIDGEALAGLLEAAEASHSTALALIHDGELVGEWYRGDEPEPIHAMSVTKAVLHLVIGRLITLGELESIDVPVHRFYPQWAEDEQRSAITIRHLLAHTSGLDRGQPAGPIYQSEDFVQFALDAPLEFEPGSRVVYSNNATNLLGGIVGQIIEQPLDEFLAGDLFGLLGIEHFSWDTDPAGNPQGMAGLQLTAGDLARLGQLALEHGRWQGEQLIDAGWFEESFVPASEHSEGMGLIWFLHHEDGEVAGVSHGGYLGQWLGVRFDERLVGVRMVANSPAYDGRTDSFRDFLERLPALVTGQ
jgi:CubicO group peptidase (beta-lactamase class C family)